MEPNASVYTNDNEPTSTNPQTQAASASSFKRFLASKAGYYTMVAVFAVILWGLTLILASNGTEFGGLVALACAFFGWRSINRIQPAMFLWMSWVGWMIYFAIKLTLSVIIGVFVAPFRLGKWVAGLVNNSLKKA